MIKEISIKNYKSVLDLKFPLGRFNILIGENGCGKSNILEAISYGVAASLNKLDNEYLGPRGIRLTDPKFMVSAFEGSDGNVVEVDFSTDDETVGYVYSAANVFEKKAFTIIDHELEEREKTIVRELVSESGDIESLDITDEKWKGWKGIAPVLYRGRTHRIPELKSFSFFCPEESVLRRYNQNDFHVQPLGCKGEGLFKYLKELYQTEEGITVLEEIKENLALLDWFDTIEVPKNQLSNEYSVQIRDKYINETLAFFDERSTNEGFLYLLFYLTLFISKDTPSFFAIDNIESSFNPKLCKKVVKVLTELAKKHNKQVIVTTHNPFALDGLDISDDEQRLFVVRRNDDGHTKLKRVEYKPEYKKNLSELWMSGLIGGLPDNF